MEYLAVVLRFLHIGAAAVVIGGTAYKWFAIRPAWRTAPESSSSELREQFARNWRPVVLSAIAILLITGLVNFVAYKIPEYRDHPSKGTYHALMGVKILAALAVFHMATLLTAPGPRGAQRRARSAGWLAALLGLFALILVIGAKLANFEALFPGPPVQPGVQP